MFAKSFMLFKLHFMYHWSQIKTNMDVDVIDYK